jgi:hypothetical protein
MANFTIPTEKVELPSRGYIYPKDSILSKGTVEIKHLTAKEEDILTNLNYIKDNSLVRRLIESIVIDDINYSELCAGDEDAILIAARISGYGQDYITTLRGKDVTINLGDIEIQDIDYDKLKKSKGEFSMTTPKRSDVISFRVLTNALEDEISAELTALRKIDANAAVEGRTRLKYMITAVNGDSTNSVIRDYIDNYFLAIDLRAFRKYYKEVTPAMNLTTKVKIGDSQEDVRFSIGPNFFWPDV